MCSGSIERREQDAEVCILKLSKQGEVAPPTASYTVREYLN